MHLFKRSSIGFVLLLSIALLTIPASAESVVVETGQIKQIVIEEESSFGVGGKMAAVVCIIDFEAGLLTIRLPFEMKDESLEAGCGTIIEMDMQKIADSLNQFGFYTMPEYLKTGIMDGDFFFITVHLKNGDPVRVGGLLANEYGPDEYLAICGVITDVINNMSLSDTLPST